MKLFAALALFAITCHTSRAVLTVGDKIQWTTYFQSDDYVKDPDDCKFGYRMLNGRVLQVFNCTSDNPEQFFSLAIKSCAAAANLKGYTDETCAFTPQLNNTSNRLIENDPLCASVRKGVAPDPEDCSRFLQCANSTRMASRVCPRGLFFNVTSYVCDHMWKQGANGTLIPLTEENMCQSRPLKNKNRRNYMGISIKCLWDSTGPTYSVAEPVNCQYYYLCTEYNPSLKDTSLVTKCDPDQYWSNFKQRCVISSELLEKERTECGM